MRPRSTNRSFCLVFATTAAFFLITSLMQAQYVQTNLVSNSSAIPATTTDPNLINPWGMVQGPTTPFWVSDQGTNVSTLYTGTGTKLPLTVNVPTVPSMNGFPPNGPTGIVFNTGSGFPLATKGTATVKSIFIFANLNGTISGWNPGSTGGATSAVIEVNNSVSAPPPKAVYTGLAINGTGSLLYAANFNFNGGIEVYNSDWSANTQLSVTDPSLPSGYEPYNVEDMNGTLFVAYAPIGKDGLPVVGDGNGAVAEFNDATGTFIKQLINPGAGDGLDVPWGMAMAPSDFGPFSNDLLVGNFGSGEISAYNPSNGDFLGMLDDLSGKPITNGALWTLVFGNGQAGTKPNTLYITAGVTLAQTQGVMAAITPTPEPATLFLLGSGLLAIGLISWRRMKRV